MALSDEILMEEGAVSHPKMHKKVGIKPSYMAMLKKKYIPSDELIDCVGTYIHTDFGVCKLHYVEESGAGISCQFINKENEKYAWTKWFKNRQHLLCYLEKYHIPGACD